MNKVLVTGATGFIGTHLLERLGENARGVSRRDGSLIDPNFCRNAVEEIDTVIHLAWSSAPASSMREPVTDVSENLVGTLNLLEACASKGVRRFIFMSTGGTVYGIPTEVPIPETHPIQPICSYGITKAAVENYVNLYGKNHGIETLIFRGANVYGPGQIEKRGQGVIGSWLQKCRDNQPIPVFGDGSAVRDFVFIDDVIRALMLGINSPLPNQQVMNLGSGQGHSLSEVIKTIEEVTEKSPTVTLLPKRTFDVPINVLNCESIEKGLGWKAQVSLNNGVQLTWDWWLSRSV